MLIDLKHKISDLFSKEKQNSYLSQQISVTTIGRQEYVHQMIVLILKLILEVVRQGFYSVIKRIEKL